MVALERPLQLWCWTNQHLVINQLEPGEEPAVGDVATVVEGWPAAADGQEHVGRYRGVVDVAADLAAPDVFEQRQREGVPHRVKVDVGAKFGQCFQAFEEIVFDEPFLLTCCFN